MGFVGWAFCCVTKPSRCGQQSVTWLNQTVITSNHPGLTMNHAKKNFMLCTLTAAVGLALSGCGGSDSNNSGDTAAKQAVSVDYIATSMPSTADQRADVFTDAKVLITFDDGSTEERSLAYNTLFTTGQNIGGTTAALYTDIDGTPITFDGEQVFSDGPDGQSLIMKDGKIKLVTQYEYKTGNYGELPSQIDITEIDQAANGVLTPKSITKVDTSGVDGLWITCAGSITPWSTHLSSEEYEPDARFPNRGLLPAFSTNLYDSPTAAKPYHYGYIPEVTLDGSIVKHYSMGRFSHELAEVLPDERTVYFGDDGGNTGMFMYVADTKGDLSSGTLYAAKWIQTSAIGGGSADLEWVKLGSATDAEIKTLADRLSFSDLFETSEVAADGFTEITTYYGTEFLKLKPGREKAAAFLESRRYAALLGATTEFNKMEGVTFNSDDNVVYVAMADVSKAMTDTKGAIQLAAAFPGTVYEMQATSGVMDSEGNMIDSAHVVTSLKSIEKLEGQFMDVDDFGNKAIITKVANPDNIKYSSELKTLFIGEDSGVHTQNIVWAYQPAGTKLTPLATMPAGAEATGLQIATNYGGHTYLMSNFQHAGDTKALALPAMAGVEAAINAKWNNKKSSAIGYFMGIPALKKN